jgi:hypothetical protein
MRQASPTGGAVSALGLVEHLGPGIARDLGGSIGAAVVHDAHTIDPGAAKSQNYVRN